MKKLGKQFALAASLSLIGAIPAVAIAGGPSSTPGHLSAVASARSYNEQIGLSKGYNRPTAVNPSLGIAPTPVGQGPAMAARTNGKAPQQLLLQSGDYTVINNTVDGQFGP